MHVVPVATSPSHINPLLLSGVMERSGRTASVVLLSEVGEVLSSLLIQPALGDPGLHLHPEAITFLYINATEQRDTCCRETMETC